MKNTSRRDLLAATAGATATAAITNASPASAQAGPKPIFPVPATTIPVVGETDVS
jgi:fumarylpyruvate hydrolase